MDQVLIGIDGGATKVAGGIIAQKEDGSFVLASEVVKVKYRSCPSFSADFHPVQNAIQLQELSSNNINLSIEEERQGIAYAEACESVIIELLNNCGAEKAKIGIGMPGTKTADKRGITVMNNGPRMPRLLDVLERRLDMAGMDHVTLMELGNDNTYCGLGELHAKTGMLKNTTHALYIGGGTGIADAIVLDGQLVPFDDISDWMPRTWQLQNDNNVSYEHLISHLGIMEQYVAMTTKNIHELKVERIYPDSILKNNKELASSFISGLAGLILERIQLLYKHKNVEFDKIVFAIRLGSLFQENKELYNQVKSTVLNSIADSDVLNKNAKQIYLDHEFMSISLLEHAPIIGAGVAAFYASE